MSFPGTLLPLGSCEQTHGQRNPGRWAFSMESPGQPQDTERLLCICVTWPEAWQWEGKGLSPPRRQRGCWDRGVGSPGSYRTWRHQTQLCAQTEGLDSTHSFIYSIYWTLEVNLLNMTKVPWHLLRLSSDVLFSRKTFLILRAGCPSILLPYATGSVLGLSVPIPGLPPTPTPRALRREPGPGGHAESPLILLLSSSPKTGSSRCFPEPRMFWSSQQQLGNTGWEEGEEN